MDLRASLDACSPSRGRGRRWSAFGILYATVAIGIAGSAIWLTWLLPTWRYWNAADWVESPCTVTAVWTNAREVNLRPHDRVRRARVQFSYTFESATYYSSRLDLDTAEGGGEVAVGPVAWSRVTALRPGERRQCYVDPAQPARAALFRYAARDGRMALAWALALAVLLAAAWFYERPSRGPPSPELARWAIEHLSRWRPR